MREHGKKFNTAAKSRDIAATYQPKTALEIEEQWRAQIGRGMLRVLDGGRLIPSAPSTVVDCMGARARVIRPGAISSATLRESVPDLIGDL